MTTETHIDGLERRIEVMERLATKHEQDANAIIGSTPAADRDRSNLIYSATSCRVDAIKCRQILAGLREQEVA